MKKIFITDFKIGDSIYGEVFAVRSYVKKASRNNKPYMDVELADASGTIKGKIWSDDMPNCQIAKEGDVVLVNGTIEDFMSTPQLRITNLTKTEKYDVEDLQTKTKFDTKEMWGYIWSRVEDIKNPHLKKLLNNIFSEETKADFCAATAAFRVHHAYSGGLLEHTWEVLKLSESIKSHFPKVNLDLLHSGIILHDIGKMLEFKVSTTIGFTDPGRLLGHIYLGAELIRKNAPKDMPEDLLNELIHIILSHHGELEYGSPVRPMTTEAIAVFTLDHASAKLNMAYQNIHNGLGTENYTPYVSHLGTELYRSPYSDSIINEDIPF